MNFNEHDIIHLATWLHNIGKFRERANIELQIQKDGSGDNIPSYLYHTKEFLMNHKHLFLSAFGKKAFEGDDSLVNLATAGLHPNNLSPKQRIILNSLNLSNGRNPNSISGPNGYLNNDSLSNLKMQSVFEGLFDGSYRSYLSPVSIDNELAGYPAENNDINNEDYLKLWHDFTKDIQKTLEKPGPEVLIITLPFLLEKYTCYIPSSKNNPDVSLFDHSRLSAAFASCIYIQKKMDIRSGEFILIGGDLSGIQDFLYDISGKNASKNLKGRSFYLQLLVETTITKILNEAGLHKANIIYSSGGGFYILAPKDQKIIDIVKSSESEINSFLFKSFGTRLFLAADYISFPIEGVPGNGISGIWKNLSEKLGKRKMKKFDELVFSQYNDFFEPEVISEKQQKDAITGEEINPEERTYPLDSSSQDTTLNRIKKITKDQIQLGKDLKGATYLITSDKSQLENKEGIRPGSSGPYYYFMNDQDLSIKIISKNVNNIKEVKILRNKYSLPSKDLPLSFYLTAGIDFPTYSSKEVDEHGNIHYPGEPLSFDLFTDDGNFKRLGYLRMDVDHLGLVFKKGLTGEKSTFTRYASLSRQMDIFFSAHLNRIISDKRYKDNSLIIYAGGDDIFLVSRWDKAIEISEIIKNEFSKYTSKKLSISGGISFTRGKYPILRAAEESGSEEDKAKRHIIKKNSDDLYEKNSITIFGYPLNWDVEYPLVKEIHLYLNEILQNKSGGNLPSSFFERIYTYYKNSGVEDSHKVKNFKVAWQMAYDFKRLKDIYKNNTAFCLFLDTLQKDIFANSFRGKFSETTRYHSLELYNLACRWTELTKRTNDKSTQL